MMLCRWNGEWFIAQRARAETSGCSLGARNAIGPALQNLGFVEYVYKSFWHKHFPETGAITFYPEIRYRRAKVYPEFWTRDSNEPILQCRLMGWDAYSAGYSNEEQIADGWKGVGSGNGATKWIHVDDLEKIEGPPPEGRF